MNIIEAMRRSKETGERFRRAVWPEKGSVYWGCGTGFSYLHETDLLAEDWEVVPGTGWSLENPRPIPITYVAELPNQGHNTPIYAPTFERWQDPTNPSQELFRGVIGSPVPEEALRYMPSGPLMSLDEMHESVNATYRKLVAAGLAEAPEPDIVIEGNAPKV